jgi:hypothetical protein
LLSAANVFWTMSDVFGTPNEEPEGGLIQDLHDEMEEYEAPTAPPTPILAKRLAINMPYALQETDPDDTTDLIIRAGESKCSFCCLDCSGMSPAHRVTHMNTCWSSLLKSTRAHKDGLKAVRENLERLLERFKPRFNEDLLVSTCSEKPASSPKPTIPDFTPVPVSTCTICLANLAHLSEFSAFAHRAYCVTIHSPTTCPICTTFFPPSSFTDSDILWHLHSCQHSALDRDAFDALTAAWQGCMEFVHRALFPKSKAGGAWKYKTKMEDGRELGEGAYWGGSSGLRMSMRVIEEERKVEVRTSRNLAVPKGLGMKGFRRRDFGVLRVPGDMRISEGVKWEKVDFWVEEFKEEEEVDEREVEFPGLDGGEDGESDVSSCEDMRVGRDRESEAESMGDEEGSTGTGSRTSITLHSPPGIPRPTTTLAELDTLLDDFIHGRARPDTSRDSSINNDTSREDEASAPDDHEDNEDEPVSRAEEDPVQDWFQGLQIQYLTARHLS